MAASTRNLSEVPGIEALRRQMQSLALLDAILEGEWEYRYFSFNSNWSEAEQVGSMRNGSGDDLFAHFGQGACFVRGFDHESRMSPWSGKPQRVWPGVLDSVPSEFSVALNEPAFHMADTTFCIWRTSRDAEWCRGSIDFPDGDDPDGSEWMLSLVCGTAAEYRTFASDYFEVNVELGPIQRVLAHEPLSRKLLSEFPTKRTLDELLPDANEIGYEITP